MKKFFKYTLVLGALLFFAVGCSKSNSFDMKLEDIIDAVYADVEDMPALGNTELSSDNLSYYLGIESLDFERGLASEPMMTSIAHSVVVVKVKDGVDVEKTKKEIEEKADPRKWICVEAETVYVASKGNTIILIMSTTEKAKKIKENFMKL